MGIASVDASVGGLRGTSLAVCGVVGGLLLVLVTGLRVPLAVAVSQSHPWVSGSSRGQANMFPK